VVLSRDHHDVSGTDSPFRETSDVQDGSAFCADMAVQNCIGDAFRGATWYVYGIVAAKSSPRFCGCYCWNHHGVQLGELCVYVGSRLMPSITILVCLHIPGCLDRVALHNGGGVGWGEVMNGGFGLLLDGTADAARRASSMLFWDVNNGYVWSAHATSRVRCTGISLIML